LNHSLERSLRLVTPVNGLFIVVSSATSILWNATYRAAAACTTFRNASLVKPGCARIVVLAI
jgi:hypothetical protein